MSGVIVGQELARQLGLEVGDPVSVVSPLGTPVAGRHDPEGEALRGRRNLRFRDVRLRLVARLHEPPRRAEFFGLGDGITGVEIRVQDIYRAQDVARRIEQALGPPFRARDWMEVNRNLFLAFKLEKVVYFIVLP